MAAELNLNAPELRADPYPTYARLRQESPVMPVRLPVFGNAFLLTRYEDVANAFTDPRYANDRRNAAGSRLMDRWWVPSLVRMFQDTMVGVDAPDHRRLRDLVHQAFTPRRVEELKGTVEQLVAGLLDAAERKGTVDLIADFALPLPLTVISLMLGVPEEDRAPFRRWMVGFLDGMSRSPLGLVAQFPRSVLMMGFFRRLIQQRREHPGDDLLTGLVQAEEQGDRLSEDELVAMIFLLLLAGHETTVNLIGSGTLALLQHPDQLERLRRDPGLIGTAVEELLRYANPVAQPSPRFAREDLVLHGKVIPRGATVVPLLASANRDETMFARADEVDVGRQPNRHVAFGLGVHYCLGAPLARLEGRIALQTLVQRFPRMRLAVPEEALQWRGSVNLRGLKTLPLHLT
jgi:cytochrome P450